MSSMRSDTEIVSPGEKGNGSALTGTAGGDVVGEAVGCWVLEGVVGAGVGIDVGPGVVGPGVVGPGVVGPGVVGPGVVGPGVGA